MYDLVELEKRGIPTVCVVTEAFAGTAYVGTVGMGLSGLALAVLPVEVSQADSPTLQGMADRAMPAILRGLTQSVPEAPVRRDRIPDRVEVRATLGEEVLEAWFGFACDKGWTDGFPVVPPTQPLVNAMLQGTQRKPDEVIAFLPPFNCPATVEKIAINAVMAGAKSYYLETIIAAVAAAADPDVMLAVTIATTDPGNAPLIVISGPIVNEIGLNSSWGVMGPGNRANSTIGRSLALSIRNIGGGATPGVYQQHTYYLPDAYSLVLAQSYPARPAGWETLGVQLGYRSNQNVVFVMPTEGPISLSPFDSPTQPISAVGLLTNFVDELADFVGHGGAVGIVQFAPEHAAILAAGGWTTSRVKDYLLRTGFNPRVEAERRKNGLTTRGPTVKARTMGLTRKLVHPPLVDNPVFFGETFQEDVFVTVAGAPVGGHGCFIGRSSHGGWAAREVGTLAPPAVRKRD